MIKALNENENATQRNTPASNAITARPSYRPALLLQYSMWFLSRSAVLAAAAAVFYQLWLYRAPMAGNATTFWECSGAIYLIRL